MKLSLSALSLHLWLLSSTMIASVVSDSSASQVASHIANSVHESAAPKGSIAEQSLEKLMAQRKDSDADTQGKSTPVPILKIHFGHKDSPVPEGAQQDYGQLFHENSTLGLGWGWNCDLHKIGSTRERDVGDKYLRSFVIPDRHGKCAVSVPVWRVSLPAGSYTVRFSTTDTKNYEGASNQGCRVQGVPVGDLPAENSCAQGEDNACLVLRNVTVEEGGTFEIRGAYQAQCSGVNYVAFYTASDETAVALSTFSPIVKNVVDDSVAQSDPELNEFLLSIADENRDVIVTSVNAGYIDFAMNWLCSISKMGITNYFLVATDAESYNYLKERGYPVFLVKPTKSGEGNTKAVKYGTVEYQELILERTILVNKVLHLGFNILLCDIDAVWLKNPMPYISRGYDIQAQPEADGRLCGGFIFLMSSPGVQDLWQKVTDAHKEVVKTAEKVHHLRGVDESEQQLLLKLLPKANLKVKKLDSDMFPHGLKYFGPQMTYHSKMDLNKIHPAVVHNNYVIGKDKKILRFKHFGLWYIGDKSQDYKCKLE